MKLDALTDALREGRAALLNPNLSEMERAHSVKVIEGALDLIKAFEALEARGAENLANAKRLAQG